MSDFLDRLTNRVFGLDHGLLPRARSRFEPEPGGRAAAHPLEAEEDQPVTLPPRSPSQVAPGTFAGASILRILETHVEIPRTQERAKPSTEAEPSLPTVTPPAQPPLSMPPSAPLKEPPEKNATSALTYPSPPEPPAELPLRSELVPATPPNTRAHGANQDRANRISQPAPQGRSSGFSADSQSISPAYTGENQAQIIQVTIDRVEVRMAPPPAAKTSRPTRQPAQPKVNLDDYLERRGGRGRGSA